MPFDKKDTAPPGSRLKTSSARAVELSTGRLDLTIRRADWPLDELCGFAGRHNRLRGYLFVSKVLGKHHPVRPSVMTALYAALAGRVNGGAFAGPVVTVALAETATGLGQGVFEAGLARYQWDRALFLPTTRYVLNRPVAIRVEEAHCHAPTHLVYEPTDPAARKWFRQARTLVLVDDEMSTGRTFLNLARAFHNLAPGLERIVLVTITNWLGEDDKTALAARFPAPVEFASLLDGSFTFSEKAGLAMAQQFKSVGDGADKSLFLPRDSGRLGLTGDHPRPDLRAWRRALKLDKSRPVLVLGSGEFLYQPYRLAALLEDEGFDMAFQATTRTPIALGGAIGSVLRFEDNYHDGIDNFLYNVTPDEDRQIVLAYETVPLPSGHDLPGLLKACTLFF